MKKTIAFLVTAALALTMSVTAFAKTDTIEDVPGTATETVDVFIDKSEINEPDLDNAVYNIVVDWGSLDFTYKLSSTDWDPETHSYPGSWDKTESDVTVTNHSNAEVSVDAAFPSGISATKKSVTATLDNAAFDLATAVGTAVADAPYDTVSVSIDGQPDDVSEDYTIDTITISVSAKA